MVAATGMQTHDDPYPAMFRAGVERFTQLMAARLREAEGPAPAAEVDQALHLLGFSLAVREAWQPARELTLLLAPQMEQQGARHELDAVLQSALAKSKEYGDLAAEAELRWRLGVLRHLQTRYAEARGHLEASAALYGRLGVDRERARALTRLASVARQQQRLDEAERLIAEALRLQDPGEPPLAYALSVQGQIALERNRHARAAELFERALELSEAGEDRRMIAWLWVNRGIALWRLGRLQEAGACYHRAIELFDLVDDPVHQAVASMDLGILHSIRNEPAEALAYYAQAEPILRKAGDLHHLALLYNNIGYAYHTLLQRWDEAERFYHLSIEHAGAIGDVVERCNTLDNLGLAYGAQGRWVEAVAVFETALAELAEIECSPTCQALFEELIVHLDEALAEPSVGYSASTDGRK